MLACNDLGREWHSYKEFCEQNHINKLGSGLSGPRRGVIFRTIGYRILRDLGAVIHDYDKQIDTLARQHPEFALFDSFPGAGSVLVPRLIAALGWIVLCLSAS